MSTTSSEPPKKESNLRGLSKRQILLIAFAYFTLIFLILAIYFVSSAPTPSIPPKNTASSIILATSTATTPSPSTSTATITPTSRPSFTPKPTTTPTPTPSATLTPTRTIIPSLTPAIPSIYNDIYHLVDWTPELASRLIQLLEAYPNSLSTYARGEDNSGYYAAFKYAILAQREALLRFPDADEAGDWLYNLAYNYAQTGNPQAGSLYANLITSELNEKKLRLDELSTWGNNLIPPLAIEKYPLTNLPGQLGNDLIKISISDHGSAFFWLIEKPSGFESYALTSDFDFTQSIGVNFFAADITNDGVNDLAIFRSPLPDSLQPPLPRLFNIAFQPPLELYFTPEIVPDVAPGFHNNWEPISGGSGLESLQFSDMVFPPCPVRVRHAYFWNGNEFEYSGANYQIESDPSLLAYCNLVIDYSLQAWGLNATVELMGSLLPSWPPQTTPEGAPYRPDALDEWRYRLGIYHALLGDTELAHDYLTSLINNPTIPSSEWITPAQHFLNGYQDQRDIYKSCISLPYCDPDLALKSLVATFSESDFSVVIELLETSGITVSSSGFFDFNRNGSSERWIIIRHQPTDKPEFWILGQSSSGVNAVFVDYIESIPPNISYFEPLQEPPIVRLGSKITFIYQPPINNQQPRIQFKAPEVTYAVDLFIEKLNESEEGLLKGNDPARIREDLITLKGSQYFTCDYIYCPYYLYLLGLSNELSGNEPDAVNAYVDLWRDYPRSPYTIIARLKLQGLILPPTPTPSPTIAISLTPSPTLTGTQPTATGTMTPAPTPTETSVGYPYP